MKKLTTLTAALLIAIGASAQKQVQKIFFPQASYTIGISDEKQTMYVGYTDGTAGEVPISKATIKGLDPNKKGLQEMTVEYGGVKANYRYVIENKMLLYLQDSTQKRIVEEYGYDTKHINEYLDGDFWREFVKFYPEFVWITNPDNAKDLNEIESDFFSRSYRTDVYAGKIDTAYFDYNEIPLNEYQLYFTVACADTFGGFSIPTDSATITGLDVTTPGIKNVTIEYQGKKYHTRTEIVRRPRYFEYENLSDTILQFRNLSGSFKAVYDDGTSETVDITQAKYYLNSEKIGTQSVSIQWHQNRFCFDVTIIENTKTPIKFDFSGIKTDLLELMPISGNIKAIYADGTSDSFSITHTTYNLDIKNPGKQKIKVSWHGLTAPLIVNIKPDPDKPAQKDGIYQIESKAALMWYIRYVRVIGTQGNDAAISTKLLLSENLLDKKETYQQYVSIFSVSATIKGFTQSQNSKNGLFTQKQTEIIKSVPLGGKIYIEDFKVKTLDGKEVQAQALKLETN